MDPAIRPRPRRMVLVQTRLTSTLTFEVADPGEGGDLHAAIALADPIATSPAELEVIEVVDV